MLKFLFLFIYLSLYSQQNIKVKAFYDIKLSSVEYVDDISNDSKLNPNIKSFLLSKTDFLFNKSFVLICDTLSSIYKEDLKVDMLENNSNNSWSSVGIEIAIFKNLKSKKIIVVQDLMSKYFNVEDSLPNYDWKLENETKIIENYICQKATTLIKVSNEELKKYDLEIKESKKNKTSFFKIIEPKPKSIIAWYAINIPIKNGPEYFHGLPGLILELSDEKTFIKCSKIIQNSSDKIIIPSNSKLISKDKFRQLVIDKNEELNDVDFKY